MRATVAPIPQANIRRPGAVPRPGGFSKDICSIHGSISAVATVQGGRSPTRGSSRSRALTGSGSTRGAYEEIYEVLGVMPVRIAGSRRIDLGASKASFAVTQYDRSGSALIRGTVEAAVAG